MKTTIRTIRATTTTLALALASLAACGGDGKPPAGSGTPAALEVIASRQSACKTGPALPLPAATGTVKATVAGDTVTVSREDARYNCAAKLKLEATLANGAIVVREVISNPNEPQARCECDYDLAVQLKGLAPGSYPVQVLDSSGKLAGSTTVTVAAGAALQLSAKQSACKSGLAEYVAGALQATVQAGSLRVLHEDARYNCAAKVALVATVVGSEIRVQETVSNPGELALCTCEFDLTLVIGGLAPGTYTVKLSDSDGQLVGATTISIP